MWDDKRSLSPYFNIHNARVHPGSVNCLQTFITHWQLDHQFWLEFGAHIHNGCSCMIPTVWNMSRLGCYSEPFGHRCGATPKAQLIKSCELCHTTTAGEVKFNSFLWLVKKKNVLQHTSICNSGHKDLYRLYIHCSFDPMPSPRKLNFLKASWLTVHLQFYHTAKTSVFFCCEDS